MDWADLVLWQRDDARFRRFWDIQRWRFFMEEEAAMLTIHGCFRAWPAVSRSLGSTVRIRSTKSLARLDTLGHGWGQMGDKDVINKTTKYLCSVKQRLPKRVVSRW